MEPSSGTEPGAADEVRFTATGSTSPFQDVHAIAIALAFLTSPLLALPLVLGIGAWCAMRTRTRRIDVTDHEIRIVAPARFGGRDRLLRSLPRRTRLVSSRQVAPWRETAWGSWVPGPWLPSTTVRSDVTSPPLRVPLHSGAALRGADAAVGLREPIAGTDPATKRSLGTVMGRSAPAAVERLAPHPVHHLILGETGPPLRRFRTFVILGCVTVGLTAAVLTSGRPADRWMAAVLGFFVTARVLTPLVGTVYRWTLYAFTDDEIVAFRCRRSGVVTELGRGPRTVRVGPLVTHATLVPFTPPAWVVHTFAGVAAEADAELDAREARDPGYSVRWMRPDGTPA